MNAVGGIFHQQAAAQQAAEALSLGGVQPGAIRFGTLPRSLIDALGPLGVSDEAIPSYERNIVPGDILMIVTTEALPPDTIANEIARAGGLVVRTGHHPAGLPGER